MTAVADAALRVTVVGELVPKVLRGGRLHRQITLIRGLTPAMRALVAGLGRVVGMRTAQKERAALDSLGWHDPLEKRGRDG